MPKPTSKNHFAKLMLGLVILVVICTYSCTNGSGTAKEEKKDTTVAMPKDTAMKAAADTTKTDTTGKGVQTPPPGH